MPNRVDLDRGVRQRKHPKGGLIGYYVDAPGEFFDEACRPVEASVAAEAGFDVRSLLFEKRRRAAIAQAQQEAETRVRAEADRIESEIHGELAKEPEPEPEEDSGQDAPPADPAPVLEVRRKPGGPRQDGRDFRVVDADGETVQTDLTEAEAEAVVNAESGGSRAA